jgi:hypothetical protein
MKQGRKILLALTALLLLIPAAQADKGMWVLNELREENIQRMKELGLQIDPTTFFSTTDPGIANAVVIFGNGCTGVTASDQGLIFTNYHCGFGSIQSVSAVEHDYITNGFVAKTQAQELPIEGLAVSYLRETVDVTERVEAAAEGVTDPLERYQAIGKAAEEIAAEYRGEHVEAQVVPFYEYNKFYVVVYDVFTDVRLAFAPPAEIGKFGRDLDNWMWPRHTIDYSVFRVYAGPDNKPADYAETNVPYKPSYYAKISLKGVKEGDYSMTIGFPGSTDRYLTSWGIVDRIENENEPRILVRGIKQDIWKKYMEQDNAINIQYISKYLGSSNYWKNSIGMNAGLKKLDVEGAKRAIEEEFAAWVAADPSRQEEYGEVLGRLESDLRKMGPLNHDLTILHEALSGTELRPLATLPPKEVEAFDAERLYKDYNPTVAKATLPAMLRVIRENVSPDHLPSIFAKIDSDFGGDYDKYADYVYANSVIVEKDRMLEAMRNYDALKAAFPSDPAVELANSITSALMSISAAFGPYYFDYGDARRIYFKGLMEMWPDKALPSDANFTMRLSYGTVGGYRPFDAAWYDYFTTSDGMLEKSATGETDYNLVPEIKTMLRDETSFGRWAAEDGKLHTDFISNNDITGGNSGSPVFDGEGHLIGLAFDGNWEAMSGDIEFEPNLQRCICVDIRAMLYYMDHWGHADNLISELTFAE